MKEPSQFLPFLPDFYLFYPIFGKFFAVRRGTLLPLDPLVATSLIKGKRCTSSPPYWYTSIGQYWTILAFQYCLLSGSHQHVLKNVNTPGGTQLCVGYGCAARSFDHHPITKPEKTQICNVCLKTFFLLLLLFFVKGPFFKPISTFYHVNWDAYIHFDNLQVNQRKNSSKIRHFAKTRLYLNQFSNKKGATGNPRGQKRQPIGTAHPRTHLSTKYPPPPPPGINIIFSGNTGTSECPSIHQYWDVPVSGT